MGGRKRLVLQWLVGWLGGWHVKKEIRLNSASAKAGAWLSLAKIQHSSVPASQ